MSISSGSQDKLFIQAFQEIRAYIIGQDMKPGDLLPSEAQLCQSIGVSRNVLREAIKSMELMGMVEARPGKGTIIKDFNLDFIFQNVLFFHMKENDRHVRQMFEIRKALELGFMRAAFDRITWDQIQEMRRLVESMKISWEESGTFAKEDMRFHSTLFSSVGNSVLTSVLDAIWAVDVHFQLEEKLPHLPYSVAKHEAIVEALEKYDYIDFARAMTQHYSSGKYEPDKSTYEEY